eukprot:gene13131-12910_t
MRPLILAACLSLLAVPALAQSLSLTGQSGKTITKNSFEGPLLIDVLAKVGAPTGKALRGHELSNAVIVTASDGYQVVLGLAEAAPSTRPNKIILADRMDGQPLPEKDGAFRLVVEGDLRPARSARLVTGIKVVKLSESQTAGHGDH